MSTVGLFPEPERVEIPDELVSWSGDQLSAGLRSSLRVGDWEAAHRVVVALLSQPPYAGTPLGAISLAVLEAHAPGRIYRDCRHFHEPEEDGSLRPGLVWLADEELVCEAGYDCTVCTSCGLDEHGDVLPDGVWPCRTFRPMAEKLVEALGVAA